MLYRGDMLLYSRTTIRQIVATHPQTKAWFDHWVDVVEHASWKTTLDVVKTYPNARALPGGERVRFEVGHNVFRLIASFYFPHQTCYLKFFGTHREYDAVDVLTVADY